MAFQSVPDTVEVVIRGVRAGEEIINTFFGKKEGGYVQADLDALAVAVDAWVGTTWLTLMPNDYTYLGTVVRGLANAIDLIAENGDSTGAGSYGSAGAPLNVTLSVKRRSAFTGRGARGRVFLPGIPTSAIAAPGFVSSGFAEAAATILTGFKDVMDSVDFVEVIVHRVAAGVPLATAVVFTVVEYVVVNNAIDSMRRRLPGRGT